MMTAILFILGVIFLFIVPPLGVILLLIAIIALILKIIGGTGKATINTGKFIAKAINTKKCPYCYSEIDAKAKVCPLCHKDIIDNSNIQISIEKDQDIKYNNEGNNKILNEEITMNENKTLYDYKEKILELNKIYNLYKNEIYNEQEFKIKKEKWIESLKTFDFSKVETDFLNEIVPIVNEKVLENRELETIKYIVSGEYANDKYIEQQEKKKMEEEEARKKREETIDNIKNKTKEMTASTINKFSSFVSNSSNKVITSNQQSVCECGEKIEEDASFCPNCGKILIKK